MITVVLADDHSLFRKGLRHLLELERDLQVVGEAGNGAEAQQLASELRPDVVLLDTNMPVVDGLTAARALRAAFPKLGIIMLTMFAEEGFAMRARESGANSYLLKDTSFAHVISAVRGAVGGKAVVTPPANLPHSSA